MTDERARALKALAVMGALLAAGLLGSWGLQARVEAAAPLEAADFSEGASRLAELLDELPRIAKDPRAVLVFGSSLTQHGFSPERYEAGLAARGVKATAYNLGLPGADSEVQRALAERIAAEYRAAGTKAKLVLLEVTPFQLTEARAGNEKSRELDDLKLSLLLSRPLFARLARETPSGAAHVTALALQGHHSAWVTSAVLAEQTTGQSPAWWPGPRDLDPLAERKALAAQMREKAAQPAWDPRTRGEPRYFLPETADVYAKWRALKRDDAALRAELKWRVESADLLELHLDPRRVEHLYATIDALASCAEQIRLFAAPVNPKYVHPSDDGRGRKRALFETLKANGHPVVDLDAEQGFVPEDFIDTTHLEEEWGRPRFSRRLADEDLSPLPAGDAAQ